MAALFIFEVHTPHRLFFSGEVQSVSLAIADGEIGILAGHSPFTAPSASCVLCIKDGKGKERRAFVSEGILEVKAHKSVLMVDTAELPEEIDRERALAAKKEAEAELKGGLFKIESGRVKLKLRRAECRLAALETR